MSWKDVPGSPFSPSIDLISLVENAIREKELETAKGFLQQLVSKVNDLRQTIELQEVQEGKLEDSTVLSDMENPDATVM